MNGQVFLIGGGGDHPGHAETYGRFMQAATIRGHRRLALVVAADTPEGAEETFTATRDIFTSLGAAEGDVVCLLVSAEAPLTRAQLSAAEPTGVFACGGPTPLYQEALCVNRDWLDYVQAGGIPFSGVSAGAAIAATAAIVGGWRAERSGQVRDILYQGAGEGRDLLDVRPGLGLVPFTVEIHASQWGTLTRLLHAIDHGLVTEGWAIDEHTLLEAGPTGLQVYGSGHAYHLRRDEQSAIQVTIHAAPDHIPL